VRIQQLHLQAFGSFTDRTLDFSGGDEGLHVVYGPNEAGKSTALRALVAWLYGIDARSPDDHLHDYPQLRIGGELARADGSSLAFVRRKGRKNTLLAPGDEIPLDDESLVPFLAGVDRTHFTTLYGIDHERLISGGRALLQQTGDVGQALFSAALGTASLKDVLGELKAEAGELFKERGKVQVINATRAEYLDALKAKREASLSSAEWGRLHKQLDALDEELTDVRARHEEWSVQRSRLQRVQRVAPSLAQLDDALAELEQLDGVTLLAEDFADRLQGVQDGIRAAEGAIERAEPRLEWLERDRGELSVATPLLDAASVVEQLHRELGGVVKGDQDLPGLESQRRLLRGKAKQHLASVWPRLSPEQAAERRPLLIHRGRLAELAASSATLEQRTRDADEGVAEARESVARFEAELREESDERDITGLKAVVAAARQAGDLGTLLAEAEARHRSQQERCETARRQLPRFDGTLAELEQLELPGEGTRAQFEDRLRDLADREARLGEQLRELASEGEQIAEGLRAQQLAGEVPTEGQLKDVRRRRDDGWALVRRAWLDGEELADEVAPYAGGEGLAEAFEQGLHDADDVADRLRRETARVHEHADLLARRERVERKLEQLEAAQHELAQAAQEAEDQWRQRWAGCGFEPLSPREMRDWLVRAGRLREDARVLRELDAAAAGQRRALERHRAAASEGLAALEEPAEAGESLPTVLARADQLVETIGASQARTEERSRGLAEAQQRLTRAEDKVGRLRDEVALWQEHWQGATGALHLPADTQPAQVTPLLEEMAELFARLDEAEDKGKRIYGIGKTREEFEARVFELADRVELERGQRPAVEVAELLNRQLDEARTDATRLAGLDEQIQALSEETQQALMELTAGQRALAQMVEQAGAERADDLELAVQRSARRKAVQDRADDLHQQLLAAGNGRSIEALREEAADVDVDQIQAQLEACGAEIDTCQARIGELRESRGRLTNDIDSHDGSAAAAEAAERAEEALARMRADASRYLRARAAAALLRQQMEAYRRRNQGPVLQRASELFGQLTGGSFAGLRDELDNKGIPILKGVRPDHREVKVEGMSEGTCDQLYLALRLATLEQQLRRSEPMPFVVDDILIGFDDDRTETCLQVLGELAEQTQVLLFTHHNRVVELAQRQECAAGVFTHALD